MHLRVDNTLVDGVYNLVPVASGNQSEAEGRRDNTTFPQDPAQGSEEPKAFEGKPRSMLTHV